MSYKLADGSLSTDYEIGDQFAPVRDCSTGTIGDTLTLSNQDGSSCPFFTGSSRYTHLDEVAFGWSDLTPTEETKRKVQARKEKGMSYKLADGSDMSDYCFGDTFIKANSNRAPAHRAGSVVRFVDDKSSLGGDWFAAETVSGKQGWDTLEGNFIGCYEQFKDFNPTAETKRKVQARKEKCMSELKFEIGKRYKMVGSHFHIKKGQIFTVTGCICGYGVTGYSDHYASTDNGCIAVSADRLRDGSIIPVDFTKADLKDGMLVTDGTGVEHYVCGDLWVEKGHTGEFHRADEFTDGLRGVRGKYPEFDIIRVTDRDGTVLFERTSQPEKRKFTLELTDDQYAKLVDDLGLGE